MALDRVEKDMYDKVVEATPEKGVFTKKSPNGVLYKTQMVFDKKGRLVALHDEDGNRYADLTILLDR